LRWQELSFNQIYVSVGLALVPSREFQMARRSSGRLCLLPLQMPAVGPQNTYDIVGRVDYGFSDQNADVLPLCELQRDR
jgi:hypothetical protein